MKGRQVVVIGGLGFIGSNLTRALAAAGARVTAVTRDVDAHAQQTFELAQLGVAVREGDVRDVAVMREAVAGQDAVINLAGESGAVRSVEDPFTDLDVNCRGTLALVEAMRQANPSATLVFASSRLHYGHQDVMPVGEDARPDPRSFHAVHKTAAEQHLQVASRLFGLRAVVARITNPYGPGQPRQRTAYGVINRLVHQALANDVLTIYGDGAQLRDYVHVDDVSAALMAMAASSGAGWRAYNVGSGKGTALADAARTIVSLAGSGRVEHIAWPELASKVETGDFVADIARIKADLGWTPRVALAEGLARTIAHYRSES